MTIRWNAVLLYEIFLIKDARNPVQIRNSHHYCEADEGTEGHWGTPHEANAKEEHAADREGVLEEDAKSGYSLLERV